MEKVRQIRRQLLRSKRLSLLAIALTLTVLAGTILAGCLRLRERVREQIAGREGESLYEVARWQQQYAGDSAEPPLGPITDPAEQFSLILRISQLKGVAAVRLFIAAGAFNSALPATITETTLPLADLAVLKRLRPVSHFYPAADLGKLDMLSGLEENTRRVPLLEVNVPLHDAATGPLAGVAQFIIEGDDIAREYAELDRQLWLQGGTAFQVAGGILTYRAGAGVSGAVAADGAITAREPGIGAGRENFGGRRSHVASHPRPEKSPERFAGIREGPSRGGNCRPGNRLAGRNGDNPAHATAHQRRVARP